MALDAMAKRHLPSMLSSYHDKTEMDEKRSRENKPLCGEPTSKKLGLLFGTSPLAFKGLPVIAIDFGRALLRISPSMSISRDDSPPEKLQNKYKDS